MISIIVCSINAVLYEQFKNSVTETIGIEFELIRIDNDGNKYSLCEAYNLGAGMARFEYLCFAHEDILFKSDDWGGVLTAIFENDNKAGIVGIAGSTYKSLAPSGWPNNKSDLICYHLIQRKGNEAFLQTLNPEIDRPLVEVKVLDGVFLFTKKQIWAANQFDSDTFKGFHGYDLDFCLQVGKSYKILVSYEVLIEHISVGSENKEYLIASILLSKKWRNYLPVGNIPYSEKVAVEWYQKRLFALKMKIKDFDIYQILSVFLQFGFFKYFSLSGNSLFIKEIIKSVSKKLYKR